MTEMYECGKCNYKTCDKSNFNKHIKSIKHRQKSISVVEVAPQDTCDVSKLLCPYCKMSYSRKSSLTRHQKVCASKQIEIEKLKVELECKNQQLKESKKQIHNLETYIKTAKPTTYNISVKKLVQQNYPDAPYLAMLEDYAVIHEDEDSFTKDLIYCNKKNILNSYLGDIIIKYYKKEDPKDQSLWSTDSSRLKYIIKELLASKKSNWSEDNKGLKINRYIIEPLLQYIHEYINEQIDILHEALYDADADMCRKIGQKQLDLGYIREQIQNGQLKDAINKYIAPSFRFNNDKLISI